MSQPECGFCGGVHFGSPLNMCVYLCPKCGRDIRPDASPRCECPPVEPRACRHENFQSVVCVNRVMDGKNTAGDVMYFTADISVRCADCKLPFEFVGFQKCGLSAYEPMVDVTAQELRAPIKPKGSKVLPGIPGFELHAQ